MKRILPLVLALGAMAAAPSAEAAVAGQKKMAVTGSEKILKSSVTPTRIAHAGKGMKKKISYPEPSGEWTEWTEFGTGTLTLADMLDFTDALYEYEGETKGITVDRREDTADSNIAQFRFNGMFNNADIVVTYYATDNGLLKMAPQSTNVDGMEDDPLYVMDFATCYEQVDAEEMGMSEEELDETIALYNGYNYFIPSLGRYYIYLGFMLESIPGEAMGLCDMQFQLDGYTDYTPKFGEKTYYTPEDNKMSLTVDEAVPEVRYGFFDGLLSQAGINAVLNGEEGVVSLTGSAEIEIPADRANLVRNVVAVTFDESGEPLEWDYKLFTYVDAQEGEWQSLGEVNFTSEILAGFLVECDPVSRMVELQESIEKPGLYRLVNAFGECFPLNEEGEYDTTTNHYFIVDATNPDCVLLPDQMLGVDWGGGQFVVEGDGYYEITINGASEEDVADIVGTLKDGKITFPEESILIWCENWEIFGGTNGYLYMTNTLGGTCIELPSTGVSGVEASQAAPEYFDLLGRKVKAPAEGAVTIERRGGKVSKVIR